jgi:hypothetical protein
MIRHLPVAITEIVCHSNETAQEDEGSREGNLMAELTNAPEMDQTPIQITIRRCKTLCSCVCHRRTRIAAPRLLDQILGSLIVGFAGSLFNTIRCNQTMCANRDAKKGFRMDLKYFFPRWALQKVFLMTLEVMQAQPTMVIAVRNTLPANSELYTATQDGNVTRLKYLFNNRLAFPNDIGGMYGDTALHVRSPPENCFIRIIQTEIFSRMHYSKAKWKLRRS